MTSRRVLITGASKGIGRSVAEQLAAAGHRPVGIARSAPASFPGEFHVADLADRAATAGALEAILADGSVDAVVNNVGMVTLAPLGSVDLDDLGRLFDVNVRVAVQVAQAALPGMRAAGWGRIVNVTSMVALGTPERTAYGAAKAALEACTRVWAKELGPTGITVNAVAPGPTETELFRSNTPSGSAAEARYLAAIPVDRLGTPQELGAAICFLLSEDAGFITGQTLRVDGGGSLAAA
ncbi:SDR family oxidoreductase [Pseudonocardia halophobica]|uniref:SDR family oxidoreductase n=1 Tax=Pseudonocardia halophobica TaxID=29401 RepID=UPI003D8D2252